MRPLVLNPSVRIILSNQDRPVLLGAPTAVVATCSFKLNSRYVVDFRRAWERGRKDRRAGGGQALRQRGGRQRGLLHGQRRRDPGDPRTERVREDYDTP